MSNSGYKVLPDHYNEQYIVQYKEGEVRCLLCNRTLLKKYTHRSQKNINDHIEGQHHKNAKVANVLPDILLYISTKCYVKTHYISEKCGKKVYCFLCRRYIALKLSKIEEHLLGERHRNREAMIEEIQHLDIKTYPFEKQSRIADHMAKCKEESSFYDQSCICTTCNVKVQSNLWLVESHLASYTHIENEKQRKGKGEYDYDEEEDDYEKEDYSDSDYEDLPDHYNVKYLVQYKEGEVRCLLCHCTLMKNYTTQSQKNINEHIEGQNHKSAKVADVLPDILLYLSKKFNAKTHYISEKCGKKVYCFLCRSYLALGLTSIQEHLLGRRHSKREAVIEEIQHLDIKTYPFEKQSRIADHMAKCKEESSLNNPSCICTMCNVKVQSNLLSVESHLSSKTHIENEKQKEAKEEEDHVEEEDDNEEEYNSDYELNDFIYLFAQKKKKKNFLYIHTRYKNCINIFKIKTNSYYYPKQRVIKQHELLQYGED